MSALAAALRGCSITAAALGVGSVALAVHVASTHALAAGAALSTPTTALAATAGTALAATLIATPLCLGAATDRARNALSRNRFDADGLALEALRAVPAVLVGALLGVSAREDLGAQGALVAGTVAMACVNLATYVALCEDALRAVPRELEEASLALGATRWFTLRRVTWPTASRGIAAAALRAAARLLGETVPLALAVGWRSAGTLAVSLGALALLCVAAAHALREPSA